MSTMSGLNGRSFAGSSQDEDLMDSQNRFMSDNLSLKVTRLKSLAFDIESEAKEHHTLLDGLATDFDSGTGLLSGSMNRIHKVMNSGRGNRQAICYVTGLMVVMFMVIYFASSIFVNPNGN